MVLKISAASPKPTITPSSCNTSPRSHAGIILFLRIYPTRMRMLPTLRADRTRPLSVNLMQPSDPIARKMLSKGFGNK